MYLYDYGNIEHSLNLFNKQFYTRQRKEDLAIRFIEMNTVFIELNYNEDFYYRTILRLFIVYQDRLIEDNAIDTIENRKN